MWPSRVLRWCIFTKVSRQNMFHATLLFLIFTYLDTRYAELLLDSYLRAANVTDSRISSVHAGCEWEPTWSALHQLRCLHSPLMQLWKKIKQSRRKQISLNSPWRTKWFAGLQNHRDFCSKFTKEGEEMSPTAKGLNGWLWWQNKEDFMSVGKWIDLLPVQPFPVPKQ